ncbi:MAG: DUF465 domain-containing protein [Gammaproteobacteria bacterium]|nr:DUF465 domain-containing protein [Gammaproteobacteria bacterium]MCY4198386.1 DUF465 domain-containing protein [Gammaproteobacteria bacterium]MCY4278842.1 DUF465 domain-containing protein [Gammaproteobacteria bacterium]MCY4323836.1 DUF465 domain-containing protein [Gammaproteobacteria bacterium]
MKKSREEIEAWLEDLRTEHRSLDDEIDSCFKRREADTLKVQRLKKRKLQLKDMIAKLEGELIPDLNA